MKEIEPDLNQGMKNSYLDGMLANAFAVLTGGVFLTSFALHLGMNEFIPELRRADRPNGRKACI